MIFPVAVLEHSHIQGRKHTLRALLFPYFKPRYLQKLANACAHTNTKEDINNHVILNQEFSPEITPFAQLCF
jgi:hypothetical protein